MPRIEGLALYQIVGEHADIVAPNARFGILPIHVRELVLVLMADDGTQGISVLPPSVDAATEASLGWLINTDPREVFVWEGGRVTGWDGEFAERLAVCPPVDVALLDLCAKGAGCPLWALLGGRCRHEVPVYDSSVHFEDLVEPG
ncbi:MAG TPA: hypothetical protein VLH79_01320, partial [Chthonomonadales bacterium]|nr:hypothetical protein [Chthonomonadales bacterium]